MPIWYVDSPHEGEGPVHRLFFDTKKEAAAVGDWRLIGTSLSRLEQNMNIADADDRDASEMLRYAEHEGIEGEPLAAAKAEAEAASRAFYDALRDWQDMLNALTSFDEEDEY